MYLFIAFMIIAIINDILQLISNVWQFVICYLEFETSETSISKKYKKILEKTNEIEKN